MWFPALKEDNSLLDKEFMVGNDVINKMVIFKRVKNLTNYNHS